MQTAEIICLTIIILYVFFLFLIVLKWIFIKNETITDKEVKDLPPATVIIPFRNEEKNLQTLFNCFSAQRNAVFEMIFVDDHSTDNSFKLVSSFEKETGKTKCIRLDENESGKKPAIEKGMQQAKYDLIIIVDADARFSATFIQQHLQSYSRGNKVTAGLVKIAGQSGFFNKFQQLDMMAIQGVSFGMARLGFPVAVSGTNLSYDRKIVAKLNPYRDNRNILSGDDIYLLQALKKNKIPVHFISGADSIIITKEETLKGFLSQRIRWMKKSSSFSDLATVLSGGIIVLSTWVVVFSAVYQLITTEINDVFLISILLKMGIDFLLLFLVSYRMKSERLLYYFLPAFLMNLLITFFLSVFGWFLSVKWKDRKI